MTAADKALAELVDISSQVRAAVLAEEGGDVLAATLSDDRARALATAARAALDRAQVIRGEGETVTQLEAATSEGSLFVVREGGRLLAAATGPEPTGGLVFYDLRACLRAAAEKAKPKRAASNKKATARTPRKRSGSS